MPPKVVPRVVIKSKKAAKKSVEMEGVPISSTTSKDDASASTSTRKRTTLPPAVPAPSEPLDLDEVSDDGRGDSASSATVTSREDDKKTKVAKALLEFADQGEVMDDEGEEEEEESMMMRQARKAKGKGKAVEGGEMRGLQNVDSIGDSFGPDLQAMTAQEYKGKGLTDSIKDVAVRSSTVMYS